MRWYPVEQNELDKTIDQMSIQVKFFASLRERLQLSEVELASASTADEAWRLATSDAVRPDNIVVAINLEYARYDSPLKDGDEVAFFPPVTGG